MPATQARCIVPIEDHVILLEDDDEDILTLDDLTRTRRRDVPQPPPRPAYEKALQDLRYPDRFGYNGSGFAPQLEPAYVLWLQDVYYRSGPTLHLTELRTDGRSRGPGKKAISFGPEDVRRLASELDRQIGLILLGTNLVGDRYAGGYSYSTMSRAHFPVPPQWTAILLPLLCRTERFYLRRDDELIPLRSDEGGTWDFVVAVRPDPGVGWKLCGQFRRADERLDVRDITCVLEGTPGAFIHEGVVGWLNASGCFHWVRHMHKNGEIPVPRGSENAFLATFSHLEVQPKLEANEHWGVSRLEIDPVPELSLRTDGRLGVANQQITVDLAFRYGSLRVEAGSRGQMLYEAAGRRQIRRNLDAEGRAAGRLRELGITSTKYSGLRLRSTRAAQVIGTLLQEGWQVLGMKNAFRAAGAISIEVTSGIDWFELSGTIRFGDRDVPLPEILAAARRGDKFVSLGDGAMGMLPEDWLTQHGSLLDCGQREGDIIRFSRVQACLLDVMLAELPEARFDEQIAAMRERMRSFTGVQPTPAPEGFVGTLRPYQEQGLGWMEFLREFGWGGCLADDMGLGKTIQVLAMLLHRKRAGDQGPSLVVVPRSLVFNWKREAARFTPELQILDHTGQDRSDDPKTFGEMDLIITTYGTLRQDIDVLRKQTFNYAILDEAQAIKNPKSLSAKASRLLNARQRLVMTGTPVENHLGDLWSLFEFLNPGMLGNAGNFKGSFVEKRGEPSGRLDLLARMLRPFILRRTKSQVAPELPARTEQIVDCEMTPWQAGVYDEIRAYYRSRLLKTVDQRGLKRSKIHVLEALLRLRQAACHPALIDKGTPSADSAKTETLMEMLREIIDEGHKALVFSQFTSFLSIVRAALDKAGITYEYLDGQTTDRQQRVDRFQSDPACPLFLISLKAGGTGLNLTAAEYVFILDPWWNPAVEAQAIDRTHRIGQDRKVIAYRLITQNTVEARILELQDRKRHLAEAIVTESNSLIQSLTREDLELLLS